MKKFLSFWGLSLFIYSSVAASVEHFADYASIPSYAHSAIDKMIDFYIVDGTSGANFRPLDFVNRAELCKILVLATGIQEKRPEVQSFSDVESTNWYYTYVETAKFYKWIDGYEEGTFLPENTLNRAEAAKILTNAFGFKVEADPGDQQWYDKYIRLLTEKTLLPQGSEIEFIPATSPTRAEIIEQIYRFMVATQKITPIGDVPVELDYVKP